MWLLCNTTGNPNYIFFQCLAYNIFVAIIFGQLTTSSLQHSKAYKLYGKYKKKNNVNSSGGNNKNKYIDKNVNSKKEKQGRAEAERNETEDRW